MIDWFVGYALRKRLVVAMICAFVAIYGYYSWTQLTTEAYPDIADTSSQVITQAPGMAAEEVEQRITVPLERELNGTPGLLFMRSKSTFGLSLITLVFRDGIENYWSRLRINERIQNATLPAGINAGLDPVTSPTGQIYYYTLESDTKGQRELSEIERWIVIPALKQVPGVADVSNFGGITTQFQLELDPEQLVRFNLSLANVEAAINANSSNAGGSVVARGDLGFVIRAIDNSNIARPDLVERVIKIARTNNIPVQYGVTAGGNDGSAFVRYGSADIPLGWPLRYSHSPAEVIDTRDVDALARIVTAIAKSW